MLGIMKCSVVLTMITFVSFLTVETVGGIPLESTNLKSDTVVPNIISRNEWHARQPVERELLEVTPTPYVVIHHGGEPKYCYDEKTCSAIVRHYQNFHIDDRHWFDIGYNFVIGEDGNVYEGRSWDYVGAHAPGYNTQSIGICVIGDFSNFLPNEKALKALNALIKYGVTLGKIREDYHALGHRQARNTLCPGNAFYEYVQKLPRWTSHPIPKYPNGSTTPLSVLNE